MIYTVTANPSLDYIVRVENFIPGKTNRASMTELYAGGKGINVSTILSHLGMENTALGFVAGFTGAELVRMLEDREFKKDFIECSGRTRINIKLKSAQESEINGTGLVLHTEQIEKLKRKISRLKKEDVLILSGSLPGMLEADFYQELIQSTPEGTLCIVDASSESLAKALQARPFLVKPNQAELEDFFGRALSDEKELIEAGEKMQKLGAQNVLISRGDQGAILIAMDGRILKAGCPKGTVINTVGSGDSMVAGFVSGYLKSGNLFEALRLAVCCGSATAFSADLASREKIDQLVESDSIRLEEVSWDPESEKE